MTKLVISIFLLLSFLNSFSQANNSPSLLMPSGNNSNYNYVTENRILVPITDVNQLKFLTQSQLSQKTTYFDGLGRPIQQVMTASSPNMYDMVHPIEYDLYGRESKKYLPYISIQNSGSYKVNALGGSSEQKLFYSGTQNIVNDLYPFAETIFENSPLNRDLEKGAPGLSWQLIDKTANFNNTNNSVKKQSRSNSINEVRAWVFDLNSLIASSDPLIGFYGLDPIGGGQLMIDEMKDENGLLIRNFTDKLGRVVCKKVQKVIGSELKTDWIETQYIFDIFGNLRFILSPESINHISETQTNGIYAITYNTAFSNNWLVSFKYDERQRVVEKHTPNGGIVYSVYDTQNRLVLSQDENQRINNQWSFAKYDVFSRNVMKGIYIDIKSRSQLQIIINSQTGNLFETRLAGPIGYTSNVFPSTGITPQLIYYYDDYDFNNDGVDDFIFQNINGNNGAINYPIAYFRAEGRKTGAKTLILDGKKNYLNLVSFYDEYGRVTQIQDDNIIGGREVGFLKYDFLGNLIESRSFHNQNKQNNIPSKVTITGNTYDGGRRLIKTTMQINNEPVETIGSYTYNSLGQLIYKQLGNNLQKIDYSYNIRGWLSSINDINQDPTIENDLFTTKILYDDNTNGGNKLYNGNINSTITRNFSGIGSNFQVRTNQYAYDGLNRLTASNYTGQGNENFTMPNISYDDNGNIKSLSRNNLISINNGIKSYGLVDDLTYDYTGSGNQLKNVNDAALVNPSDALSNHFSRINSPSSTQYSYDGNGNLIADLNKGIQSVIYNQLNLPDSIYWSNTSYIRNIYDASGNKLKSKIYINGSFTKQILYIGGLVYLSTDMSSIGILQYIPTPEGRAITPEVSGLVNHIYEYHYRDHLNNLRVAFRQGITQTYLATMEDAYILTEPGQWNINYSQTKNNLHPCNGSYSAEVGNTTNTIGPWMTKKITKGDLLTFSAKSYYSTSPSPLRSNLSNIMIQTIATGLLTSASNGTAPDKNGVPYTTLGSSLQIPINNFLNGFVFNNQQIQSYIMYVVFDKDMHYISSNKQIVDVNSKGMCGSLSLTYQASDDGYVQVMVVNESDTPVWFDDISLQIQQSLVVQENHYDAWGLELAGIEKEGNPNYDYTFQDKEFIDDLNLSWSDFGARQYDVQLARWQGIDPANQFSSGYVAMGNNPIKFSDPNGTWAGWDDVVVSAVGFVYGYVSSGVNTGDWGGKALENGLLNAAIFELGYLTGGGGWVAGGSQKLAGDYLLSTGMSIAMSQAVPGMQIPIGDFSVTVSPSMSTSGGGFSFGLGYSDGNISLGLSAGIGKSFGTNDLSRKFNNNSQGTYSFFGGNAGFTTDNTFYGLSYSKFTTSGSATQKIGNIGLQIGDFGLRVDEDFFYGTDKNKTGGGTVTYKINGDVSLAIGLGMITGQANQKDLKPIDENGNHTTYDSKLETPFAYRGGALYGGLIYKGNAYFLGINSENVLHGVQNFLHRNTVKTPYFENLHLPSQPWSYFGNYSTNTLIY